VPSTQSDDGDPLDVLLLMDEPAFPGCAIDCRVLGIIEGVQIEDKQEVRNDRLVAVACQSHTHSDLKDISDLNKTLVDEVCRFFVNYHQEKGTKFRVRGVKGRDRAWNTIHKALKAEKKTSKKEEEAA